MKLQSLTQAEAIELCDKTPSFTGAQVKTLVSTMSKKGAAPLSVKVGDVWRHPGLGGHYCVVVFITKTRVVSLMATTEETLDCIISPVKTRFSLRGFITSTTIVNTKETVLNNFTGVYDNPKHISQLRKSIKSLLTF